MMQKKDRESKGVLVIDHGSSVKSKKGPEGMGNTIMVVGARNYRSHWIRDC